MINRIAFSALLAAHMAADISRAVLRGDVDRRMTERDRLPLEACHCGGAEHCFFGTENANGRIAIPPDFTGEIFVIARSRNGDILADEKPFVGFRHVVAEFGTVICKQGCITLPVQ